MARWLEDYRMEWIAEMLRIYGFVNRQHLQRKFGISVPQASKDLQAFSRRFSRRYPKAMYYDTSRKCYMAKESE